MKKIFLIACILFAPAAIAADGGCGENCVPKPDCESLGYKPKGDITCVDGYVTCPFDREYIWCRQYSCSDGGFSATNTPTVNGKMCAPVSFHGLNCFDCNQDKICKWTDYNKGDYSTLSGPCEKGTFTTCETDYLKMWQENPATLLKLPDNAKALDTLNYTSCGQTIPLYTKWECDKGYEQKTFSMSSPYGFGNEFPITTSAAFTGNNSFTVYQCKPISPSNGFSQISNCDGQVHPEGFTFEVDPNDPDPANPTFGRCIPKSCPSGTDTQSAEGCDDADFLAIDAFSGNDPCGSCRSEDSISCVEPYVDDGNGHCSCSKEHYALVDGQCQCNTAQGYIGDDNGTCICNTSSGWFDTAKKACDNKRGYPYSLENENECKINAAVIYPIIHGTDGSCHKVDTNSFTCWEGNGWYAQCPANANCQTTDNKCYSLTSCKTGFVKVGGACVTCDTSTYYSLSSYGTCQCNTSKKYFDQVSCVGKPSTFNHVHSCTPAGDPAGICYVVDSCNHGYQLRDGACVCPADEGLKQKTNYTSTGSIISQTCECDTENGYFDNASDACEYVGGTYNQTTGKCVVGRQYYSISEGTCKKAESTGQCATGWISERGSCNKCAAGFTPKMQYGSVVACTCDGTINEELNICEISGKTLVDSCPEGTIVDTGCSTNAGAVTCKGESDYYTTSGKCMNVVSCSDYNENYVLASHFYCDHPTISHWSCSPVNVFQYRISSDNRCASVSCQDGYTKSGNGSSTPCVADCDNSQDYYSPSDFSTMTCNGTGNSCSLDHTESNGCYRPKCYYGSSIGYISGKYNSTTFLCSACPTGGTCDGYEVTSCANGYYIGKNSNNYNTCIARDVTVAVETPLQNIEVKLWAGSQTCSGNSCTVSSSPAATVATNGSSNPNCYIPNYNTNSSWIKCSQSSPTTTSIYTAKHNSSYMIALKRHESQYYGVSGVSCESGTCTITYQGSDPGYNWNVYKITPKYTYTGTYAKVKVQVHD